MFNEHEMTLERAGDTLGTRKCTKWLLFEPFVAMLLLFSSGDYGSNAVGRPPPLPIDVNSRALALETSFTMEDRSHAGRK